jgi:hypothetical protein
MNKTREVYSGHGHDRAMGYKFRCRVESRTVKSWIFFGPEITQYRYVVERYFMAWEDVEWGYWCSSEEANRAATERLDKIEGGPIGHYIA